MGNNIGGRNKAKVMRTNGETFKFKTPIDAWEIMKSNPGYVLLESEAVKQMGLRAEPLGSQEELKPNTIYFLVETSMFLKRKPMKKMKSNIVMSTKNHVECFALSRRSVADLSARQKDLPLDRLNGSGPSTSPVQVKVRLPKAQLTRLMEESRDGGEVARKIIELYAMKSIEVVDLKREEIESMLHQVGSW